MAVREILLLGNPKLYELSEIVSIEQLNKVKQVVRDLEDTLLAFRDIYGFGRAIAAPQIDEFYRIIYMNLSGAVTVFINPVIHFEDSEVFKLWDDCMSFPGLEVEVFRYKSCKVNYLDINFQPQTLSFEGDLSELFQHEYDHLDGILAVDRAIDLKSFRMTTERKIP